jgi:hypothetical protein
MKGITDSQKELLDAYKKTHPTPIFIASASSRSVPQNLTKSKSASSNSKPASKKDAKDFSNGTSSQVMADILGNYSTIRGS